MSDIQKIVLAFFLAAILSFGLALVAGSRIWEREVLTAEEIGQRDYGLKPAPPPTPLAILNDKVDPGPYANASQCALIKLPTDGVKPYNPERPRKKAGPLLIRCKDGSGNLFTPKNQPENYKQLIK